jgi:hypothetical protein
LVFFSISGTKLPHYILPAIPPFAVLVAFTLLRVRKDWPWEHVALSWSACVLVVAQYTYTTVWNSKMREVQDAAKYVRAQGGRLVVYKLGPSTQPDATLEMRETSHPSILFYLRDRAVMTDDPRTMRATPPPYYILTNKATAETDPEVRPYSVLAMPLKGPCVNKTMERIDIPGLDKHVLMRFSLKPVN